MTEKTITETVSSSKLVLGKKIEYSTEVLKTQKAFFSYNIEPDRRIAITEDQQVIVGIATKEEEKKEGIAPRYKFMLGCKAITNLLIAHFDGKGKPINEFLNHVIRDLQKITQSIETGTPSKTSLLGDNEIPYVLRSQMNSGLQKTEEQMLVHANKKITDTIQEIQKALADTGLKRSEMNRRIIRWYLLFDWKYPNNVQYKFLRKDEYQRMSIYHYCLDTIHNKPHTQKQLLQGIQPHMPQDVRHLLNISNDIKELYKNTAEAAIEKLQHMQTDLATSVASRKEIFSKLRIKKGSGKLEPWICFHIHPILPLKLYYRNQLEAANGKFSLSAMVRQDEMCKGGLHKQYYAAEQYLQLSQDGQWPGQQVQKRKIIGALNVQLTQDILLYRMARKYLENVNHPIVNHFKQHQLLKVSNLREQVFTTPVDAGAYGQVMLAIKFHQLDDFLIVESKPVITRAVIQMLRNSITSTLPGVNGAVVLYDEVFKEIQRVYNNAVNWAHYLLRWEESIVKQISPLEKNSKTYISFVEVCKQAGLNPDSTLYKDLTALRNAAFHAEIPEHWSYADKENDAALCTLLQYQPKQRFDYQKNDKP